MTIFFSLSDNDILPSFSYFPVLLIYYIVLLTYISSLSSSLPCPVLSLLVCFHSHIYFTLISIFILSQYFSNNYFYIFRPVLCFSVPFKSFFIFCFLLHFLLLPHFQPNCIQIFLCKFIYLANLLSVIIFLSSSSA